jgi:hypothetical protein
MGLIGIVSDLYRGLNGEVGGDSEIFLDWIGWVEGRGVRRTWLKQGEKLSFSPGQWNFRKPNGISVL